MAELEKFQASQVIPVRDVGGREATATNINSTATTNATSLKAALATLRSLNLHNYAAAARTFKLYDKASAPTVGTDVPILQVTIAAAGDCHLTWSDGLTFGVGLAYAITVNATVADATAVAAGDIVGKIMWS